MCETTVTIAGGWNISPKPLTAICVSTFCLVWGEKGSVAHVSKIGHLLLPHHSFAKILSSWGRVRCVKFFEIKNCCQPLEWAYNRLFKTISTTPHNPWDYKITLTPTPHKTVVGCCWNRLNESFFVAALLIRLMELGYFEKFSAACRGQLCSEKSSTPLDHVTYGPRNHIFTCPHLEMLRHPPNWSFIDFENTNSQVAWKVKVNPQRRFSVLHMQESQRS